LKTDWKPKNFYLLKQRSNDLWDVTSQDAHVAAQLTRHRDADGDECRNKDPDRSSARALASGIKDHSLGRPIIVVMRQRDVVFLDDMDWAFFDELGHGSAPPNVKLTPPPMASLLDQSRFAIEALFNLGINPFEPARFIGRS
jgi:hypothetical protein